MDRYRVKIDKKFSESFMNHGYVMVRQPDKPIRLKYAADGGRLTLIDEATAKLLTRSWERRAVGDNIAQEISSPQSSSPIEITTGIATTQQSHELNRVEEEKPKVIVNTMTTTTPSKISQKTTALKPIVNDFDDNYGHKVSN